MTRETTIGLVVSCSFLCLVGVVIVTKMRPGTGPTPHPDTLAEAEVTVPPAPTPVAPPGPPLPWGGEGRTSLAASGGHPVERESGWGLEPDRQQGPSPAGAVVVASTTLGRNRVHNGNRRHHHIATTGLRQGRDQDRH